MKTDLKNRVLLVLTAAFLAVFALWGWLKPDDTVSLSERRTLSKPPVRTAESVWNGQYMSLLETYTLDQFPLRDSFRAVKAATSQYLMGRRDNHDIYQAGSFLSKLDYPLHEDALAYAASRMQLVYQRYLENSGSQVYFALIPDKNYFLAQSNGYPALDYDRMQMLLQEQLPFAESIDLFSALSIESYYRTDSHWRQECLADTAAALAQGMGQQLEATYTVEQAEKPFLGVYGGQYGLPVEGEPLCYLTNAQLQDCTVYDHETGQTLPVYDLSAVDGADPYTLFLFGSKSLLTIENPNAKTDRELILFRDSFGSSIAPLLAEAYAKITLVDIRYISPLLLDRSLTFTGQDVLFLYSTSVLNNSETMK